MEEKSFEINEKEKEIVVDLLRSALIIRTMKRAHRQRRFSTIRGSVMILYEALRKFDPSKFFG